MRFATRLQPTFQKTATGQPALRSLADTPSLTPRQQGTATTVGLAGVGGAALYAGAIGAMSAGSWDGAGTGALFGGGLSAVGYAVVFAMARAWVPALVMGGLGGAGIVWGGKRAYKAWGGTTRRGWGRG